MSEQQQPILHQIDDSISRITLNRPHKRNALNAELIAGLKTELRRASETENVRVIIINGAGSDFCSGADLESLRKISEFSVTDNLEDARSLLELFVLMRQLPLPVIAAVHGRALAGGCGLASACDLIVAASSARFGYPEVKIGFVPAMVLAILRRNIGEKRAFELITRGVEINAEEARQIGLVNAVFSDERFSDEVIIFASAYMKTNKLATSLTKGLFYQIDGLGFEDALQTGVDINVIARLTEDFQRGVARFLARK